MTWVATFHAEEEMPYEIARAKFKHTVEWAAEKFVDRIPHPEVTQHWVTIEEETDDLPTAEG
jgi:hypothetical protein